MGGFKVLTAMLPNADAAKLRQMGDMLRDKAPNVVAVLASTNDGKPTFLAVCGKVAVGSIGTTLTPSTLVVVSCALQEEFTVIIVCDIYVF